MLMLALAPWASAQMTPSVSVSDQPIVKGTVVVEKVVSNGPGWIVIHAQKDGKPGPILGYSPVADGENTNVVVEIDATKATPTLYAMLHTDAGQMGTFEFPNGPDVPMKAGDQVITPPFQVTGGLPTMLPTAGGGAPFWPFLLVVVGGLALVSGLGLTLARRTR